MATETTDLLDPQQETGEAESPNTEASGDGGSLLSHPITRRSFLSQAGAASVIATAPPLLIAEPAAAAEPAAEAGMQRTMPVTLNINGEDHHLQIDARTTLLDCLRENLAMPGTKKGCDHGQCGACTVHVNGRRVNSCLSFAAMHVGDKITTIEGLGSPDHMHPMQAAFVEHDAYQCGYCTSGQIMSAVAAVKEGIGPTDEDVRHAVYGNICRCGAYSNIVAAVQQARKQI
ncbi:MAG TPA: (2Fe-2S)-binding protein [Acidobacteriaceae bacterium]|nr:(2Fe-2S)-binding protein [Acidobacteriaceae bacterium]